MSGTANAIVRLLGYHPAGGEEAVHSAMSWLLLSKTRRKRESSNRNSQGGAKRLRLSGKQVGDCWCRGEKMATLELNTPAGQVLEAVRHVLTRACRSTKAS